MSKLIEIGSRGNLLTSGVIAAASGPTATAAIVGLAGAKHLSVQAKFLYGSGGTSAKAYVQTSLDGGVTWVDIMSFAFTTAAATKVSSVKSTVATAAAVTATDGTLTDNTILDGVIGDRLRVKWVTTGTYGGATSLALDFVAK